MLFQLKLFSIKSDVIRTTYDKSTLPYLLMYIMGKYDEKFEDQALEPSQLVSILLEKYPADFFEVHQKALSYLTVMTFGKNIAEYGILLKQSKCLIFYNYYTFCVKLFQL